MADKLPILLFAGDARLCYGIFRSFSNQLYKALLSLGEDVIYTDIEKDELFPYLGKKYKAIIAFEERFFYSFFPNTTTPLFDYVDGPILNFWVDHPITFYGMFDCIPSNYHILTLDRNYVDFIHKYYTDFDAYFLPPGGTIPERIIPFSERKYNLSFVGTYIDWKIPLEKFNGCDENTLEIVHRYVDCLISNCTLSTEDAFNKVLLDIGAEVTGKLYLETLAKLRPLADRCVARLFRENIIDTLLQNDISIDVFGNSWNKAPFADNPNLHIHEELSAADISKIYADSKMSLNIMGWHKDSITERILDTMLSESIVISDETGYLRENFKNEKDILLFPLDNIDEAVRLIKKHSNDYELAVNGYKKAIQKHTWKQRAKEILELIDKLEN